MAFRECVVCGKTFDGAPGAKYCSEECKNAPRYTNEFNGEKWGKLTIIDAYRKRGRVYAICKCECGNTKTVRYDALTSGRTQSCGCFAEANYYKPFDLAGKINDYGCKAIKQIRVGNRYKWAATIVFKGKTYHLGRYHNIEDAAAVRKEAEDALFGDFLEWFQEVYPERWEKFNKKPKTDGK